MSRLVSPFVVLLVAAVLPTALAADPPRDEPAAKAALAFNRDVLPILADNCFKCHGPDKNARKSELRLDRQESALALREGVAAVVPGKPEKSELVRRITADDEERMPPAEAAKRLAPEQIEILRRWIAEGARWEKHWAFIPPQRPPLPKVKNRDWAASELDLHVLAKLEKLGLAPSPEAEKTTLIRRVTLDLTGLPPTPEEVDAFLADPSPDAYEKLVERLLASPRFGERVAARWLDAARYADTNGYQTDGERSMWRWRDWVIESFNANMPFDQFTVEQLAGDLLPNPTLDQIIATGFNRNHRGNSEGGIIPEEYAVEYVVDRVETTSTVWLGLTLGCARCHEHKYDPFAQQEFYRLFAFFNNVPEQGRAIKYGNSPPAVPSPTRGQQAELRDLDRKLGAAKLRWAEMQGDFQAAQAEWEKSLVEKPADPPRRVDWTVTRGLATRMDFDGAATAVGADGAEMKVEAQGAAPSFGQGKLSQSAQFDGSGHLALPDAGAFGFDDKFTLAAWIYCDEKPQGTILSRMVDVPRGDGYYLVLEAGKVQLNLVKRWLDDSLRVETENAVVEPLKWHHILATYDGTRYATGVKIFVDGRPQQFRVNLDELNQDFATKEPLRIAAGGGPAGLFRGRIDDVRLYRTVLSPDEAAFVATAESISELAQIPPSERTPAQAGKLAACFLEGFAPEPIAKAHRELMELRAARQRLVESFPTTMVMQELPEPRETFVLMRGQYDKPGERVDRGVPEVLNSLRADAPRNRLGLARWLVDPANPLTARVTVNRFWQMHFGVGLVKTAEDFGTQGDRPANQDLLDYLAWRFVESGWDVKAILREIVTSSTYRQSSRTSPQLARLDPDNRLFARGPRLRLSAEMVRDQALFASGLLIEEVGGPSVRPYQPPGLWEEVSGTSYKQGSGAELYRRSLYTFWKRTIAPPSMLTFDASGREFCVVRETRTNTPLQALALMNEVTYVEAARVLAQNLLRSNRKTPEERLNYVFQLATSRRPTAQELAVLTASLDRNLARFRQEPQAAAALIATGEYPVDRSLDAPELAAYTAVTGLILNLDEAITKE